MWKAADMMAVELVLILGLLVSAHCEVRARDPEVEEEEEELGRRTASGGRGAGAVPPILGGLPVGGTELPPQQEGRKYPARNGNWCACVQKRVVTTAIRCGMEKYTIRSQSPCSNRHRNCGAVIMYRLSNRPIYRQQEKIVTELVWCCCPGHEGQNCQEKVTDAQLGSGQSAPIGGSDTRKDVHATGFLERLQHHVDPNIEQNDYRPSTSEFHYTGDSENQQQTPRTTVYPGHVHSPRKIFPANTHQQNNRHDHHQQQLPQSTDSFGASPHPYPEAYTALPVPHMMALVMSELRPVLEGFNRSLEHLSWQVRDLAHDVAQLQRNQLTVEQQQSSPVEDPELHETAEEQLEMKLYEVYQHIARFQRQLVDQQQHIENQLHAQHTMLHYNLTSFKMDIDMKLKRHHKMLQVSLQDMNITLAELKLEKDQTNGDELENQPPPPNPPQPSDTSVLWEAIERLDNMVINNTVKVGGLMEDMEVTSGDVQKLKRDLKELVKQINQTARNSQVLFMETGLEVEAAREAVLRQVGELVEKLRQQGQQLHEVEEDVQFFFTNVCNNSENCDFNGLKATVARLERDMDKVTELANENHLALHTLKDGGAGVWDSASDWEPAVEGLQHGLQQVRESLTLEQNKTATLERSLNQLSSIVRLFRAEISGLNEVDQKLKQDIQYLSGSFSSLLKDGIRHSEVLELLLEEEVPEFLEWPVQDQEAHSIPALKEQLSRLQEQLREHNLSITSLLSNRTGHRVEVLSADQPSSSSHFEDDTWLSGNTRRSSSEVPARERQLLHPAERQMKHKGDGSDLWNLEKTVEEVKLQVLRLEEKCQAASEIKASPNGIDDKLQAEVTWLKRGLEEHLRVFKNVFSNADVLAESDATLELDKLWQFVKNKDGKKDKKRRGSSHRSRRDLSGVVSLSGLSEHSLLVTAGSPVSVLNGIVSFKASLNWGQHYSDTGTFTAPVSGIYLFVLTLDLHLGPTHLFLRKESGVAPVSLHQQRVTEAGPVTSVGLLQLSKGEEVRLELKGEVRGRSEDNVLTVMLLHQNT